MKLINDNKKKVSGILLDDGIVVVKKDRKVSLMLPKDKFLNMILDCINDNDLEYLKIELDNVHDIVTGVRKLKW